MVYHDFKSDHITMINYKKKYFLLKLNIFLTFTLNSKKDTREIGKRFFAPNGLPIWRVPLYAFYEFIC